MRYELPNGRQTGRMQRRISVEGRANTNIFSCKTKWKGALKKQSEKELIHG